MLPTEIISATSIMLIFIEGLLSFFSPCVLPLLPVYMGYISGNIDVKKPYAQRTIFFLTLCFIVGIFTAIFLLNASLTLFQSVLQEYITWIIRVGGIFIILLGIHQLGIIKFHTLEKTVKLNIKRKHKSSFVFAFLLGFTLVFHGRHVLDQHCLLY